jgi:sulfur-oxidizing protein SoxY
MNAHRREHVHRKIPLMRIDMPHCKSAIDRCKLTLSAGLILLNLGLAANVCAVSESQQPSSGAWESLHHQFYGERDIGEVDENFMSIGAPANTPDPAATPIVLHFGKDAAGKIKQVRVIIDNNPSPLAATLDLKAGIPIEQIDLRVRIDRFTSVRAIAETTDGRLEMRSTWVKASGGCSAPPAAAEGGTLGEIRFRPSSDATSLQMSIRHPNSSGFQIDPLSGDAIPPHYISHLKLSAGNQVVMEADTGISLSENPTLRIASEKPLAAPLTLEATDIPTRAEYSGTWKGGDLTPVKPAASGGR